MAERKNADQIANEMADDMARLFEKYLTAFCRLEDARNDLVPRTMMLQTFAEAFVKANQKVVPAYAKNGVLDHVCDRVDVEAKKIRAASADEKDYGSEIPSLSMR